MAKEIKSNSSLKSSVLSYRRQWAGIYTCFSVYFTWGITKGGRWFSVEVAVKKYTKLL
jgi:hypothetical protein